MDDDQTVLGFINKYITVQLPDPHTQPELYKQVTEVQKQNHSKTRSTVWALDADLVSQANLQWDKDYKTLWRWWTESRFALPGEKIQTSKPSVVMIPWRTRKLFSCRKPSNCKRNKLTDLSQQLIKSWMQLWPVVMKARVEGCILHWTGTHLLTQVPQIQMSVKAWVHKHTSVIHLSYLFKIYSCYLL